MNKKEGRKILKQAEIEQINSNKDLSEILRSLPDEEKTRVLARIYMEERRSYNGPLPAPEDFQQYEQVLPGAADRILSMAEKQLSHRTDLEKSIVKENFKQSSAGQIIGGILALFCIVASFFLGIEGHDILAGVIASTTVIGVITVFVLNKKPEEEKEDKSNNVDNM